VREEKHWGRVLGGAHRGGCSRTCRVARLSRHGHSCTWLRSQPRPGLASWSSCGATKEHCVPGHPLVPVPGWDWAGPKQRPRKKHPSADKRRRPLTHPPASAMALGGGQQPSMPKARCGETCLHPGLQELAEKPRDGWDASPQLSPLTRQAPTQRLPWAGGHHPAFPLLLLLPGGKHRCRCCPGTDQPSAKPLPRWQPCRAGAQLMARQRARSDGPCQLVCSH